VSYYTWISFYYATTKLFACASAHSARLACMSCSKRLDEPCEIIGRWTGGYQNPAGGALVPETGVLVACARWPDYKIIYSIASCRVYSPYIYIMSLYININVHMMGR